MKRPGLSRLQVAWLQEIGLDKRMLAHYLAEAEPFAQDRDSLAQAPGASSTAPAVVARAHVAGVARATEENIVKPGSAAAMMADAAATNASGTDATAPNADKVAAGGGMRTIPTDWEALRAHIAACEACGLHIGRSQAVFGDGAQQTPEWMIVGEAPGDYDDRAGLPFQGKAGVLLAAMLAAVGVDAQAPVFFTNLMKCRPLGNRPPSAEEIAACLPFLRRQIALLQPRRILALGTLAAQSLLETNEELAAVRGRIHQLRDETGRQIPLVATHHPASLLLRPQFKPQAWEDLNLARSAVAEPAV
jgi:DNA polymerase